MRVRWRRLRVLVPILSVFQLTVTLGALVALVGLSNWLDHANQDIIEVMMDSERCYRLQLAIMRERQDLLDWKTTADDTFLRRSLALTSQTAPLFDELAVNAEVVGEPLVLERARRAMVDYEDAELQAEQSDGAWQNATQITDRYRNISDSMDTFVAATDELLTLYVDRVVFVRQEADRVNRAAAIGSVCVSLLLVASTSLFLWRLAKLVGPVPELQAIMSRLSHGDLSARAPLVGIEEFDSIASGINALAVDLQLQRSSRNAFLGGVAHDLRNPMNAMRLTLGRIQPGSPLPDEQTLRRMGDVMARQLALQERLVLDLLDQARLEAGEVALARAEVSLMGLCRGVVELLAPTAPTHRLVLSGEQVRVVGDPGRLEQVLVNLISNAIKFSPNGGRVEVRVGRSEDRAEIVVMDEGIGIAPSDLTELFQPFRRSPRVADIPGSGLGLSAVRRIVEAHGGSVNVESGAGGTSFRVLLPTGELVAEPLRIP